VGIIGSARPGFISWSARILSRRRPWNPTLQKTKGGAPGKKREIDFFTCSSPSSRLFASSRCLNMIDSEPAITETSVRRSTGRIERFHEMHYSALNIENLVLCLQAASISDKNWVRKCGGCMPQLKLLVVEDDPVSLEFMAEVFSTLKIDVCPISDSRQAAILVSQQRFDGIFLDIETPGLNGFELAQLIRESPRNKSTPIIIVTGVDEPDAMHRSFAIGATFFLQKPVDSPKLAALLATIQDPSNENRRRYNRVPMEGEVTCCVRGKEVNGISWNLSQGGMQLEVRDLPVGETVQLSFRLPRPPVVIQATGVVVWANDERQGVFFTKMPLEHQAIVRDFIAQVMTSPPK
jgi:CheY-like chemotaxis protein